MGDNPVRARAAQMRVVSPAPREVAPPVVIKNRDEHNAEAARAAARKVRVVVETPVTRGDDDK